MTVPLADPLPAVAVRSEKTAYVTVRVPGYAGSAIEGTASVQLSGFDFPTFGAGATLESGLRLGPVEPGTHALLLARDFFVGCCGYSIPLSEATVTLAAGENQAAIAIPPLHEARLRGVRGLVRCAPAGTRGWELFREASPEGTVAFPLLPAGEYVVALMDGVRRPTSEMRLTLPGPAEVVFAGEAPRPPKEDGE